MDLKRCVVAIAITISVLASADRAVAIDYRWTSGSNMGESGARIRNKAKDEMYIFCSMGQEDKKAGIYLTIAGKNGRRGKKTYVQFVVDGKNYPLEFDGLSYEATGRGFYNDLYRLVEALTASKSTSFVYEIPEENFSRRFSLLNASDEIGKPPKSLIDPCA